MAHTVYACPNCDADLQAVLTRRSAQSFRPKETIICRDCLAEFPWQDAVIRKSATMLRGLGGVGSSASGPPPVFLGSGSFYDETFSTSTLTIPAVTVQAGQTLFVAVMVLDLIATPPIATVDWSTHDVNDIERANVGAGGDGSGMVTLGSWDVTQTATSDIDITLNNIQLVSAAAVAFSLSGLANPSAVTAVGNLSFGAGTSTTPTTNSASNPPPQPNVISIAALGTQGPQSDSEGVWTNGFTGLVRAGTEGATAGSNSTIAVAFKYPNSVAAITAGKTGITSRKWGILARPSRMA